jgi:hypothetical protein
MSFTDFTHKPSVVAIIAFGTAVITAVSLVVHCLMDKEKFKQIFERDRNK